MTERSLIMGFWLVERSYNNTLSFGQYVVRNNAPPG
jgi:hypothetical protein